MAGKTVGPELTDEAIQAMIPGAFLWDGKLSGLGVRANLERRTFLFRYRNAEGKQRYLTLGRHGRMTLKEARTAAKIAAAEVAKGGDPQQAGKDQAEADRSAPTVANLADYYLGDHARSRGHTKSTARNTKALVARIKPLIGHLKIADVTERHIKQLHGDFRREGEAAGHKGIYQANRLLSLLRTMFDLAIRQGDRTDNPCRNVVKFKEDTRWRQLKAEEVARLRAACDDYAAGIRLRPLEDGPGFEQTEPLPLEVRSPWDREAADAILLLLFTGSRLQEVLRAEWSQFDLLEGRWEKPATNTKSGFLQRLELEGPALDLLVAMEGRKRHPLFLFPGNPKLYRKERPIDIRTGMPVGDGPRVDLRSPWIEIQRLAGLENVRLHDLRRTLAGTVLSGGGSLATVQRILGHKHASTTERYATLAPTVQKAGLGDAGRRMMAYEAPAKGELVPFSAKGAER